MSGPHPAPRQPAPAGAKPPTRRSLARPLAALAVALPLLVVAWTTAQSQSTQPPLPVEQAATTAATELPTIQQLFAFSPVINTMIAGLSVLALFLFLYFLAAVSTRAMMPQEFVNDVTKLVLADKLHDVAELCRRRPGVLSAGIIQRCVENAGKGHDVIMDIIDSEGRRRADIVWNRISYLADISNVAPMFGLLGTVLGMTEAFFGLELQSASINSAILANSIGKAMSTTMFGLVVAILALVFYSIIKARATRTLAEVEQLVHSIADHVKRDDVEAPTTATTKEPRR